MARVYREPPPNRLAIEVTDPSRRYQWTAQDTEDQPLDLEIGWASPGGDALTRLNLARQPASQRPDVERLNEVRVYAAGNETLLRGLITKPSFSWGEAKVGIEADGYRQTLDWNPTLRVPYIDRSLDRWRDPSSAEKARVLATPGLIEGTSQDADTTTGLPALFHKATGAWDTALLLTEAWYDAGPGANVGGIYSDWKSDASVASQPTSAWVLVFELYPGDLVTSATQSSGDQYNATADADNGWYVNSGSAQDRHALIAWYVVSTATIDQQFTLWHRKLTVIADHGLTLQTIGSEGGADGDQPGGLLGSDVLAHGLTALAPPVTWTTGSNGTLQPTTFAWPHFVIGLDRGASVRDLIEALDRAEGRAWGVHGTDLFWRPKGSGRKWRLRRDQIGFSEQGESADSAFTGVVVSYTDPAGTSKSVGPPGALGVDDTDTDLADTSEENPVNARGLGPKNLPIEIGVMTTLAGATQIGRVALREITRPTRGTGRVVGLIEDERGQLHWPHAIRDDDVVDLTDEIGGPERLVTDVVYAHEDGVAVIELDGPEKRLDVLLARLDARVAGLALG